MYRILVILAAIAVTVQAGTPVEPCRNQPHEIFPIQVNIKGCDKLPCEVYTGKTVETEVDFMIAKNTKSLNLKLGVELMPGSLIDYPLEDNINDICKNMLYNKCPLEAGEVVTHKMLFPIMRNLPSVRVGVEVSAYDENKNIVYCFAVKVKVVKSK